MWYGLNKLNMDKLQNFATANVIVVVEVAEMT